MQRRSNIIHVTGMVATLMLFPRAAESSDETNIPSGDRIPRPAARQNSYRNRVAQDLGNGGWKTFLGDLHVHSRGHTFGLVVPNVNRSEVHQAAHLFGFDFLAITNHTTSWSDSDEAASLFQYGPGTDAYGQPNYLGMKGSEDYVGPDNVAHTTSFNRPLKLNTNLEAWHQAIASNYDSDPLNSVHVQLNHPNSPDPFFSLPKESPIGVPLPWTTERVRNVRDAIEVAEYNGLSTYLTLLGRGFRVAPASNSDQHARFRQDVANNDDTADDIFLERQNGAWVKPYFEEPGVPRELVWGDIRTHNRTGIVLPASMPWNYDSFLTALRNRWVFRATHPRASGFFMVNGRPMGSEFSRASSENRLDFTVWATTLNGHGGGGTEWTRLEVWSPTNPNEAVFSKDFTNPELLDLKHTFSLMAYEPVYVIRLEQAMGADVVLAPVWVTNPLKKPSVSFQSGVWQVARGGIPTITISDGAGSFLVQRASGALPLDWQTVASITQPFYHINTSRLPKHSWWRVVDATQTNVASNALMLTVSDALEVALAPSETPPVEVGTVAVDWAHSNPVRAAYYATKDAGVTWLKMGEETSTFTSRRWRFDAWQWGGSNVMLKVVDADHPALFGTTVPFVAPTEAPPWFFTVIQSIL